MHEAKIDRSQNDSHKINIKSMLKKTSIKDVYKHYPLKVIILYMSISIRYNYLRRNRLVSKKTKSFKNKFFIICGSDTEL